MFQSGQRLRLFATLLTLGLLVIFVVPIATQALRARQERVMLSPGDVITVNCETGMNGTVEKLQALVNCAPLPTTATPVPGGGLITGFKGVQEGQALSGKVIGIEALVARSDIASVMFELSGPKAMTKTEKLSPYVFPGDIGGKPLEWDTTLHPNGDYTLKATATDKQGQQSALAIRFRLNNGAPPPTPTAAPGATTKPTTAPTTAPTNVAPSPTVAAPTPTTAAPPQFGADAPNVYLSAEEIAAIKEQVKAGKEPWASAYRQMIGNADKALNGGTYSITKNGGPNNGHDYHTDGPYCGWKRVDGKDPDCRDGQFNSRADRADYSEAIGVGRAVRDLGMAYAFTNDKRYADKAIALIRVWTLDPKTRMTPKYTNPQSLIELSITMPGMFYGADLLGGYSGWPAQEKQDFHRWVAEFTTSAKSWTRTNNFENWRVNLIAASGALRQDKADLDYAFKRFKEIIPNQIDSKGQMTQEIKRKDSLGYSLYAINAMVQTAEIARQWNVDLYNYTTNGRGLKLALDYHAPYVASPSNWPHSQAHPYDGNNAAIYELAYSYWEEPTYMKALQRWGRPTFETRILGAVTLTHANGLGRE
jgi:hypothetical protein